MSCEGSRGKFFEHVANQSGGQLTARQLESIYQANRRKPASPAEAAMADAKTRLVFGAIQALGFKPPSHAQDGLPKAASRLGYAAVYDELKRRNLLAPQAATVDLQQAATPPAQASPIASTTGTSSLFIPPVSTEKGMRDLFFQKVESISDGITTAELEMVYEAGCQAYNSKDFPDGTPETRSLFALMQVLGLNMPAIFPGGTPELKFCLGYARVYSRLAREPGLIQKIREQTPPNGPAVGLDGRDAEGYDRWGYNKDGFDREGYDRDGFDREGYNQKRFNRHGFNTRGYDKRGCDGRGLKKNGRDRHGFDIRGYNKKNEDADGYTTDGYKDGYDRNGYDRDGRDRNGSQHPFFLTPIGTFFPDGRDITGFDADGYDEGGYDRFGFKRDGYNCFGFDRRGLNARGFDRNGKDCLFSAPDPPPITPKATMTYDEFARTIPSDVSDAGIQYYYREATNPEKNLLYRWQQVGRAIDDPLACHNGYMLRCPYCGKFTRDGNSERDGGMHKCPHFDGRRVEVWRSGVVHITDRYDPENETILFDPRPEAANYDPEYPGGYNGAGFDKDGFDRQGYNEHGRDRNGYTRDGFDVLGYDRDGFDREGYNREGYNRVGEKRARTLAGLANVLDPGQDLLSNQDLAMLYSQIATGLVGKPRRVVLQEGGGFGTDMRGTITADPYPLGRQADPRHNLVVTRAGIHHELGHELFTPPEVWAQVLEVAEGKQKIDGLGEAAAKLLPRFFNIVEDGRMERRLANGYAGVAEVLAASCRLEPRWHEQVGEGVPVGDQVFWALLYTSLPFFRVRSEVRNGMTPQARVLFDELEPVVHQAVQGEAGDALAAAVHLARRFEEEGLIQQIPPQDYSQFVKPPPGTKPRQGQPGSGQGQPQPGDSNGQGQGSPGESGSGGKKGEDDAGDQGGAGSGGGEDEQEGGDQARAGAGEDEEEDREQDAGSGGPGGAGAGTGGQEKQSGGRELGDPDQTFGDKDVEAVARSMEREVAAAIEAGVRRRSRKDTIGKPLHAPLGSRMSATQRYFSPEGAVEDTYVKLPIQSEALARMLEQRRASHKRVAADMARQLRAIREQTEQTLRRQSEGRLDRHQLVGAVKGLTDVHTRTRQMPRTSFAVSMAIDLSGSMDEHIYSGALYDATMTLGDTFDMLEMPYEVRGFGSTDAQFKAMDDPGFAPERAACLTRLDLGGTLGASTAGLAASALLARDESNKLMVVLSDGDMGDHSRTARTMLQARRDGIVTFGVFLGPGANTEKMNELYGAGNWATINSLSELPTEVGRRLSALFKRMRK